MPSKASEWQAKHTTLITLRFNHNTDADILAYLQTVPSKQGLVKRLLREHMHTTTNNKEDKTMTKVINANGTEIDYNAAVALMDDDICAELNDKLAPCTEQEFFSAYEQAHADKYGEEWELSKANPCY